MKCLSCAAWFLQEGHFYRLTILAPNAQVSRSGFVNCFSVINRPMVSSAKARILLARLPHERRRHATVRLAAVAGPADPVSRIPGQFPVDALAGRSGGAHRRSCAVATADMVEDDSSGGQMRVLERLVRAIVATLVAS